MPHRTRGLIRTKLAGRIWTEYRDNELRQWIPWDYVPDDGRRFFFVLPAEHRAAVIATHALLKMVLGVK